MVASFFKHTLVTGMALLNFLIRLVKKITCGLPDFVLGYEPIMYIAIQIRGGHRLGIDINSFPGSFLSLAMCMTGSSLPLYMPH